MPSVRATIDSLPLSSQGYESKTNIGIEVWQTKRDIRGTNASKIHDFYAKLSSNVQALEALGKLKTVAGYVRLALDKLEGIQADLVRADDDWHDWGYAQLLEQLRKWTERNSVNSKGDQDTKRNPCRANRENFVTAQGREWKPKACPYCEATNHKSTGCTKVGQVAEQRRILVNKALCFIWGNKALCRSHNSC
jgi:hypothetical protein